LSDEKLSTEAYAYTPGLKVKYGVTITKERKLPLTGEVIVREGATVAFNDVVAKAQMPGDPQLLKISARLGVDPDEVMDFMLKKQGDPVEEDELIARYRTLFGLVNREFRSPVKGYIEMVSTVTGQAIVRAAPVPIEVKSYIPGRIVKVLPKEGVVIETRAAFVQGIFGLGGETHGKLKFLVDSPGEVLTEEMITSSDRGHVIIGGSYVTLPAFRRAVEVGASGVVAGGFDYPDTTRILGEALGVAITGHEEIGCTLIITEGFGKMTMSQRTFNLLKKFEGYMASINGATQIRAGVQRPEIIIPHEEPVEKARRDELEAGIMPGTPIRIIREPYFGAIGRVLHLPVELQLVETGSYVRVLVAKLDDGREVTVPRANVEIIEE